MNAARAAIRFLSPAARKRASGDSRLDLTAVGVPLTLTVLVIVFGVLESNFLTGANWENLLRQGAVLAIVALGLGLVMISGGLDLSVGSTISLSSVITAMVAQSTGLAAGFLAGIAVGAGVGIVNGLLIAIMRIPPFIATLGMLSVLNGVALLVTDGLPVHGMPEGFAVIGTEGFGVVPYSAIVVAVVLLALWLLIKFTRFGAYVYGVGADERATWLGGVRVTGVKFRLYLLCGLLSGVGAVILSSRVDSGQPQLGQGMELDAIAVVLIGGVSLSGGSGSVVRIAIAALLISVLQNGLNIVGVESFWQDVAIGGIIILAATVNAYQASETSLRRYFRSALVGLVARRKVRQPAGGPQDGAGRD